MSIEALAMPGADYNECGINLEKWEHFGVEVEQPPAHLLVEEYQLHDYSEWGINHPIVHQSDFKGPREYLLAEEDDLMGIVVEKSACEFLVRSKQMVVATEGLVVAEAVSAMGQSKICKICS